MRIVSVLRLMSTCTPFRVENTATSPMFSRRGRQMELESKSTTASSGQDRTGSSLNRSVTFFSWIPYKFCKSVKWRGNSWVFTAATLKFHATWNRVSWISKFLQKNWAHIGEKRSAIKTDEKPRSLSKWRILGLFTNKGSVQMVRGCHYTDKGWHRTNHKNPKWIRIFTPNRWIGVLNRPGKPYLFLHQRGRLWARKDTIVVNSEQKKALFTK